MADYGSKRRNIPSRGVRGDPVASRLFRILCLFVVFGVACPFGSWRRVVGRCQKRRADGEVKPKMADSSRKKTKYTNPRGSVAILWRRGGFAFSSYLLCLALHVNVAHGGGWRDRAENEGLMRILRRKWSILVSKAEIYRPAGVRIDPVAWRRCCVFFLLGISGVACQFGSWRQADGSSIDR